MWGSIVCGLALFLAARIFWRRWNYDLHKIPSPPGLPLLGHALDFLVGQGSKQIAQWIGEGRKRLGYPKLMRIELMGQPWLVVADDVFIKEVMMSPEEPFPKVVENGGLVVPLIGNDPHAKAMMMKATAPPFVKAVRKIYATGCQSSNLKIALHSIQDVMNKMMRAVESKRERGPVDVQELFVKAALDVIGAVGFEANLGGLDGSRPLYGLLIAVGYIARERFFNPLKTLYCAIFRRSQEAQRQNKAIERLTSEWKWLTDEIMNRDDPLPGEEPMWHGLKHLIDPETGKPAEYSTLVAEVGSLVVAAMDTTGHQIGWIVGLLAAHPEVVEKILEELKEHKLYGADAKPVKFEDLGELTYLTAVIKEGLRMTHITTAYLPRQVPKDMTILGYRVPQGTHVMRPGNRAFNTEEEWCDPENFRPERWLAEEDLSMKLNVFFSTGPRDCAGQKLAMMEMRLAIIKIISQYQLTLEGPIEKLLKDTVDGAVIEARGGIWVHITPREHS